MKSREMEIKAWDIITYSLDGLKLQSMMIPNVCEDVQDGNHRTLLVGVEVDTNALENNSVLPCKAEYVTILPSNK